MVSTSHGKFWTPTQSYTTASTDHAERPADGPAGLRVELREMSRLPPLTSKLIKIEGRAEKPQAGS